MRYGPAIIMLIASASLLLLFAFPIWRVTLIAPQFPEGLYMEIWVNKITGQDEYVLQNINILNHYIGMQPIEEDEIPELQYFPYVIIGLSTIGIISSLINKGNWFLAWSILLAILCAVAIYDFWRWEYRYGHDLDPKAPIKVPGMTYQPPLLGRKMLLNFEAISYPATGAWILLFSIVASFGAFLLKRRIAMKGGSALVLLWMMLSSCTPKVKEIHYGQDQCIWCKMTVSDKRYGGELVTEKGKVYKFDAVECMLYYMGEYSEMRYSFKKVVAFNIPGELQDAETSYYLVSQQLGSPMGADITAFSDESTAMEFSKQYAGEVYDWQSLLDWFKMEFLKNLKGNVS